MLQAGKFIGSGLASIGLTKQILAPVLSPHLLCPSVISKHAEEAIIVVDGMLQSLPQDSVVINHITQVAENATVVVNALVDKQLIIPAQTTIFTNGNITPGIPKAAGVYAFTELVPSDTEVGPQQAFGSTVAFPHRLVVHKAQFAGTSRPTNLHYHGNRFGGISSLS